MSMRFEQVSQFAGAGTGRAAEAWRTASAQPGWVARAALLTFVIIIGVPLGLLILFALIAAMVVFTVLALGYTAWKKVRGLFPANDGRSNVRVIDRHQTGG